jgi:hypothetical protein
MIGVHFRSNERKLGFINSNLLGIPNKAAAIENATTLFELSRATNDTDLTVPPNVPRNYSEYGAILWSGYFEFRVNQTRAKEIGFASIQDMAFMSANQCDLDDVCQHFYRYWPSPCREGKVEFPPVSGWENGHLSPRVVPEWPSRIVIYENGMEVPVSVSRYGILQNVEIGWFRPVIGVFDIVM